MTTPRAIHFCKWQRLTDNVKFEYLPVKSLKNKASSKSAPAGLIARARVRPVPAIASAQHSEGAPGAISLRRRVRAAPEAAVPAHRLGRAGLSRRFGVTAGRRIPLGAH